MTMKLAQFSLLGLTMTIGCSPASRSPDAIRQRSASATEAATRSARAVVQGIFDGLKQKGPININKATEDDLVTLPGIDRAKARRIVAGRPYANSDELVTKRILTKQEYNQIATSVKTR